jgi:hypothetical protein
VLCLYTTDSRSKAYFHLLRSANRVSHGLRVQSKVYSRRNVQNNPFYWDFIILAENASVIYRGDWHQPVRTLNINVLRK